ncbi:MAG: VWA domain-containing protein [Spirochaetota bacterium]
MNKDSEAEIFDGAGYDESADSPKRKESSKPSLHKNSSSGLKAGFADDNKQFTYYINFFEKYKNSVPHLSRNISERIKIKVVNGKGKPVFNQKVEIQNSSGSEITSGQTHSDGSFFFYPSHFSGSKFFVKVRAKRIPLQRQGKREIEISTSSQQNKRPGMDIVFIMDTTGSMGEEIRRLKNTIEIIYLNLQEIRNAGKIRFGMVLYRDKGDSYRTRTIDLTDNLQDFQTELAKVEADGGGDYPEDLQEALHQSIRGISWNQQAIKLGYIITDASLHLDYQTDLNYIQSCEQAKKQGIKFHSIGTGGLPIQGEFVLRQISQLTYGKYIFLTYGEKGESEGGKTASVSHHTGANYNTDKLESIIIKFSREEIENINGKQQDTSEYFLANPSDHEKKEETLKQLFQMALGQLVDYSNLRIKPDTTVSILPVSPQENRNSEYFSEQLLLSLRQVNRFTIVDRDNMQKILEEIKFGQQGLSSEAERIRAGKLLGAETLLTSKLYQKKNNFEMYLKLIRTETGEVLSVSKLVIAKDLGI